jgi:hypothetical protein
MALNKDVLGAALKTMADNYNNIDAADVETARINFWNGVADEIINHIKTAGVVHVNVTTTGTSTAQSGSGTGTIT